MTQSRLQCLLLHVRLLLHGWLLLLLLLQCLLLLLLLQSQGIGSRRWASRRQGLRQGTGGAAWQRWWWLVVGDGQAGKGRGREGSSGSSRPPRC